jgi:hypothetical protein
MLFLATAFLGCCKPQLVPVPPPPPPRILRPALRIHALTPASTDAEILRAYVLDLADQVGYASQLEILLYGTEGPR